MFVQCRANVEDVGPTLYKCYENILCFLGMILRLNAAFILFRSFQTGSSNVIFTFKITHVLSAYYQLI